MKAQKELDGSPVYEKNNSIAEDPETTVCVCPCTLIVKRFTAPAVTDVQGFSPGFMGSC